MWVATELRVQHPEDVAQLMAMRLAVDEAALSTLQGCVLVGVTVRVLVCAWVCACRRVCVRVCTCAKTHCPDRV